MKFSSCKKICRLLIMVLCFNIIASSVLAGQEGSSGTTILCTSAGLITVNLADFDLAMALEASADEAPSLDFKNSPSHTEHCPYCQFSEPHNDIGSDLPPYPVPESILVDHYQSLLPIRSTSFVSIFSLLRAPPNHYS